MSSSLADISPRGKISHEVPRVLLISREAVLGLSHSTLEHPGHESQGEDGFRGLVREGHSCGYPACCPTPTAYPLGGMGPPYLLSPVEHLGKAKHEAAPKEPKEA